MLAEMLGVIAVASTGHAEAVRAFTLEFTDPEDAMQAVAAEAWGADFILTRNVPDFKNSPVPAMDPGQFLTAFP